MEEHRHEHESGLALVTRLALAKARAVAEQHPEAWVIGSDQAAVLMDAVQQQVDPRQTRQRGPLHRAAARAARAKRSPSSRASRSCARATSTAFEFVDTTRVTFRVLDEATIERYVAARIARSIAPADSRARALGIRFARRSTATIRRALIGLPLIRLCEVLRRVGFDIP